MPEYTDYSTNISTQTTTHTGGFTEDFNYNNDDSYDTFTFWSYYPNSGFTLNPSMISSDTFVISNM